VTAQLRGRAERDPKVSNELRCRTKRITFCDIGRYGEGGASNLIDEGEMPTQRRLGGEAVRDLGEVVSCSPDVKRLKLSHRMNVEDVRANMRIMPAHMTVFSCRTFPVSRFPFPVSCIPSPASRA
jgi:hypothetical protein